MNNIAEKVLVQKNREGFDIYFEALPDHTNLEQDWVTTDTDYKYATIEKIHQGKMVQFSAQITAEIGGIEFALEHTPMCVYKRYADFYSGKKTGTYEEITKRVVRAAQLSLEQLMKIAS